MRGWQGGSIFSCSTRTWYISSVTKCYLPEHVTPVVIVLITRTWYICSAPKYKRPDHGTSVVLGSVSYQKMVHM